MILLHRKYFIFQIKKTASSADNDASSQGVDSIRSVVGYFTYNLLFRRTIPSIPSQIQQIITYGFDFSKLLHFKYSLKFLLQF